MISNLTYHQFTMAKPNDTVAIISDDYYNYLLRIAAVSSNFTIAMTLLKTKTQLKTFNKLITDF